MEQSAAWSHIHNTAAFHTLFRFVVGDTCRTRVLLDFQGLPSTPPHSCLQIIVSYLMQRQPSPPLSADASSVRRFIFKSFSGKSRSWHLLDNALIAIFYSFLSVQRNVKLFKHVQTIQPLFSLSSQDSLRLFGSLTADSFQ